MDITLEIERAARAICTAQGGKPDRLVTVYDPPLNLNDPLFETKRAAIAAIPEWRQVEYLSAAYAAQSAFLKGVVDG